MTTQKLCSGHSRAVVHCDGLNENDHNMIIDIILAHQGMALFQKPKGTTLH